MQKIYPLIALIAIFAGTTDAQNFSGPNSATRLTSLEADLARFLEADDDVETGDADPASRPRLVTKASAVKASVITNAQAAGHTAFDLINQKRAENGLQPLQWSDKLAAVALVHSRNMAEFKFFSHKGLDSKYVSDRADNSNVGRWRSIGENIAFNRGYADPITRAVQLWLESPSHRNNMLDPHWTEAAVGVAVAEDGSYYFTQVFLKR